METFEQRAERDGLKKINNRTFLYEDKYGAVRYIGSYIEDADKFTAIPYFTVFASPTSQTFGRMGGFVSEDYKFIGNDIVVRMIKESIVGTGKPILRERTFLNAPRFTHFWHEIEIQNVVTTPRDGDVVPQLTVQNSYDGTGVARVSFGFSIMGEYRVTFKQKMGSYHQIHTSKSKTVLSGVIGSFFEIFNENIVDIISETSSKILTDEDILKSLAMIEEKAGKNRRNSISAFLAELCAGSQVTNWNMFLAIAKFSSKEGNLNAKLMLDNIAERLLVVPPRMIRALRGNTF
jgi:hypothetical protein